jgi:uncharacterized membrane protein
MMGAGLGTLGVVFVISVWAGLIGLAVWLVRQLFPTGRRQTRRREEDMRAQEILERRYAQGELSEEQYEHIKRTLAPGIRQELV